MIATQEMPMTREAPRSGLVSELQYEQWRHWPVNWSAVWVGTLASVSAVLLFGLIGIAVGAQVVDPANRIVDLRKIGLGMLVFSVFGAFLAFVIGGWIAGKIAGILHSEPAMLHGAIVWLLTTPALLILTAFGAGSSMGAWHGGLGGTPSWASPAALPFDRPENLAVNATEAERTAYAAELATYRSQVKQWKEDSPKVVRNSALGAITALLLGLVGSVIGGWMASGEPMTFTHYKTRKKVVISRV